MTQVFRLIMDVRCALLRDYRYLVCQDKPNNTRKRQDIEDDSENVGTKFIKFLENCCRIDIKLYNENNEKSKTISLNQDIVIIKPNQIPKSLPFLYDAPSDQLSIVSPDFVNGFLNLEDEEDLESAKKLHELNLQFQNPKTDGTEPEFEISINFI